MQTGHEKTLTALMAALAGTNLIYGLGMIESGVTFDYAQLVIDNEMARMVKHVVGGVRVDDESLAVDDIAAVGSFGDFLSLEATMRHMRDTSQPELIDRRVREDWEARGASDMYPRALVKAQATCWRRTGRSRCRTMCCGRCGPSSTRRTNNAPASDDRGGWPFRPPAPDPGQPPGVAVRPLSSATGPRGLAPPGGQPDLEREARVDAERA